MYRNTAGKRLPLLRTLAKLRRAGGAVRDLDVHRKMLEAFAKTEAAVAENSDPEVSDVQGNTENGSSGEAGEAWLPRRGSPGGANRMLRRSTLPRLPPRMKPKPSATPRPTLRRRMGHERDKAAKELQEVLTARQGKFARAGEALMQALEPAQDFALEGPILLHDAEKVLERDGLLRNKISKLRRRELHTVRKAAKAARYVAESLPEDEEVAEAARSFEALQEAGGQWHDAWQLARAARRHFGKGHELTGVYREERDRKLGVYRAALETRAGQPAPKPDATAAKPAKPVRADLQTVKSPAKGRRAKK